MKPHEQEWIALEECGLDDDGNDDGTRKHVVRGARMGHRKFVVNVMGVTEEHNAAVATLAAAAPDLARALLAVEWVDRNWCIVCDGINPSDADGGQGHAPDCALAAALRKAGVR